MRLQIDKSSLPVHPLPFAHPSTSKLTGIWPTQDLLYPQTVKWIIPGFFYLTTSQFNAPTLVQKITGKFPPWPKPHLSFRAGTYGPSRISSERDCRTACWIFIRTFHSSALFKWCTSGWSIPSRLFTCKPNRR